MKRSGTLPIVAVCMLVLVGLVGDRTDAFPQYSIVKNDNIPPDNGFPLYNYCRTCHGDFNAVDTEMSGETWPSNLMDTHVDFMVGDGDCSTCHSSGPRFPVILDSSQGGAGLEPIGCVGCHGRAEDVGAGTDYGLGLRRHHWNVDTDVDIDPDPVNELIVNTRICASCHFDADPSSGATPVGENVKPPYYADPDGGGSTTAHAPMPSDPCADPTNADVPEEEKVGDMLALDNDGDLAYDVLDTDCMTAAGSPGETAGASLARMRVTSSDATTISLTYGPPCGASGNTIVFGPLDSVSTYAYSGEACGFDNSGAATWDFVAAAAPQSFFFLVVGHDGANEGSYGLGQAGERPEHSTNVLCPLPQDLVDRCD